MCCWQRCLRLRDDTSYKHLHPPAAGTIPLYHPLVGDTIPLLLVLSPCWWYYPPVGGTIPLYRPPGACTLLYRDCKSTLIPLVCTIMLYHPLSPWWWCGQRCLYDHLSFTDLIAHQPSPAPDRLIVSQEHQFSVLF